MLLADQLKKLRNENGLTQKQMAEKIYVSRAAIAKWETQKGYPDISNIIAISELFQITLDELIKGS